MRTGQALRLALSNDRGHSTYEIEWFSKRTGTSFQNGTCRKNVDKKLGRERRRFCFLSGI